MKFSPQQDEALKAVSRNGSRTAHTGSVPAVRLCRHRQDNAGRHFAEHVDGDVQFAAFTGKAAQVLRAKGASNARTIHSLIYRPKGEEEVSTRRPARPRCLAAFSLNRQSDIAKAVSSSSTNARWSTRNSAAT
jgi:exodeoxyribonuclease-5